MARGRHTGTLTRRAFVRGVAATGAVAAGAVLAACGEGAAPTATAPAAPTARATTGGAASGGTATAPATTAPTTAATAAATTAPTVAATTATGAATAAPATAAPMAAAPRPAASAAASPTAMTAADGKIVSPAPELGVPDAFTKYPPAFRSVPAVVGKGGKVTALLISYDPPVPPKGQNLFWQEFEKRLGVTWEPTIVPAPDYEAKFAATLASGDIPDLVFFSPPPGYERTLQQGPCADLTPYLSGDAIKEFPNLAAFPAFLWRNVSVNKKIYGVPRPRMRANGTLYFRQDWAAKLGFATQKNSDDVYNMFVAMAKNDPDGNGAADTYGLSSNSPRPVLSVDDFAMMWGAPNEWRLNPDGTLTNLIETDEYRKGLEFARRLWAAGAYHPDAANLSSAQNRTNFEGGKIGAYNTGSAGMFGSTGVRAKARQLNPNADVTAWTPVSGDGSAKPSYHTYIGYFGFGAISARAGRDRERTKELLRVLDYLAAPFGSEEYTFLNYGVEGVHYDVKDGLPVRTERGKAEAVRALWELAAASPPAFYDVPGDAERMQKIQTDLLRIGVDNPKWGYFSPTAAMKTAELDQLNADRRVAIVTGREPLATLDAWVKDWRSRGGDMIRKEYQDAIKGG